MLKRRVLDREISYKKMGSGPPLVLIHGYGGSHADWQGAGEILSTHFTVYLPYFSHHYLDPHNKLNFINLIDLVAAFIASIHSEHKEKVSVAGSSFGSALVWGVSIRRPEHISRMVLASPMPPNPARRLRDFRMKSIMSLARIPKAVAVLLSSPIGKYMLPYLEEVFQLPWTRSQKLHRSSKVTRRMLGMVSHSIERFAWIIRNEDWMYWESRLAYVKIPTLILCGEHDPLFARSEPKRFYKLFKYAELRFIKSGGHVMSREMPKETASSIERFLGGIPDHVMKVL